MAVVTGKRRSTSSRAKATKARPVRRGPRRPAGAGRSSGSGTGVRGDGKRPTALIVAMAALIGFVLFRVVTDDSVAVPEKLTGDVTGVHDPMLVRDGETWYLFSTGWGIPVRRSSDLAHWETVGSVFPDGLPGWVHQQVPGLRSDEISGWAPDVSKVGDRWHLYWSIGVFGTTKAVIGHASNAVLDPADPRYEWVDEGPIVASKGGDGGTMAIDPNAVTDANGDRWLAWGSFGQGIMLQRLDNSSGAFLGGSKAVNIARRTPFFLGIEGAHIVQRDGWWYLFASFGFCCRGVDSSYSIHVGRSKEITGPYVDAEGIAMMGNGGTTLTGSYANVIGPGHGSLVENGDDLLLVNHFYDRNHGGRSTLMLRPVEWGPDGWPYSPDAGFDGGPVTAADVVGKWRIAGYPEEAPARAPDDVTIDLRADGTIAPSGRWKIEDDIVRINDVGMRAGVRHWWLVVDADPSYAFGRDNRSAAVRAMRIDDGTP